MRTLEQTLTYIIAPTIAALLGWVLAKRKNTAEIVDSELDNVEKSLAIYRGIIVDLQTELDKLRAVINKLSEELEKYKRNEKKSNGH